jgi:hypothetical protein|tara:strand:- start:224 stop:439 length:216 start_codon:yes stop_codon:yes gene_type:complete
MGSLSKAVSEQRPSNQDQKQENKVNFDLNVDEIKFILAKLAQIDFKGVEIEFTYNLIVKLQEHFRYLSKRD